MSEEVEEACADSSIAGVSEEVQEVGVDSPACWGKHGGKRD